MNNPTGRVYSRNKDLQLYGQLWKRSPACHLSSGMWRCGCEECPRDGGVRFVEANYLLTLEDYKNEWKGMGWKEINSISQTTDCMVNKNKSGDSCYCINTPKRELEQQQHRNGDGRIINIHRGMEELSIYTDAFVSIKGVSMDYFLGDDRHPK